MSDVRKLGVPFLIIILGAFMIKLVSTYIDVSWQVIKVLETIVLCAFGASLNATKRKGGNGVIYKVLAIVIVVILLLMELGVVSIPFVVSLFTTIGIYQTFVYLLYIFSGYIFME